MLLKKAKQSKGRNINYAKDYIENMKQYPRIFSLSTVGIIYHNNCDYLLHPLRTDFTGGSGSGKSVIADLLQLIFVAKRNFGSREPML